MVKIYCPSGYTYRNRGDALLILSLDAVLQERFGTDSNRIYSTMTPQIDSEFYGLTCVPLVAQMNGPYFRRVARLARLTRRPDRPYVLATAALLPVIFLWACLARFNSGAALRLLPSASRASMRPIVEADVVVAVPGGYLLAPVVSNKAIVSHVVTLATATFLGKKVTLSPCSIGPAAGWYEPLLAWLLRRVDVIVVREKTSLGWVREHVGAKAEVVLATDVAFVDAVPAEPLGRELKPGTIGISVKRHSYPRSKDPGASHASYVREIAQFVEHLPTDREVVFVPQVTAGGDNDLLVAEQVVELLPAEVRSRVTIEDPELTPGQLRSLYGQVDVLVGTRMHANILSLLARTPVVAIAYEAKTRGIMSRLGLENYVIDIEDVTAVELKRRLEEVQATRAGYLTLLEERLPGMRQEAGSWLRPPADVQPALRAPLSETATGVKNTG